jgi:DNA repair exonuclease SbcCD ATPase subunit
MKNQLAITVLSLVLLIAGPAHSQEDKKAGREKEALRRTQQALRTAQERQSALEREKAALALKLDAESRKAETEVAGAQRAARASRSSLAGAQAEISRLKSELDALRARSDSDRQAVTEQNNTLKRSLQETQHLLVERTQTATSLARLLDRSTQALANAERKNRDLYASSRLLLDLYRNKSAGDALAQREPLLGFAEVALENEAEALRTQLEAHRLPTSGRDPASNDNSGIP